MVFWGHMVRPKAPRKEPQCDKGQLHQKYVSFSGLAGLLPTEFSLSSSSSTEKHIWIKWILSWNEIRTTRNKVPQFWKKDAFALQERTALWGWLPLRRRQRLLCVGTDNGRGGPQRAVTELWVVSCSQNMVIWGPLAQFRAASIPSCTNQLVQVQASHSAPEPLRWETNFKFPFSFY